MNLNVGPTTLNYEDNEVSEARVSFSKRSDDREVRLNGRLNVDGEIYLANMSPDALYDIICNYIVEHLDDLQIILETISFTHDVDGDAKVLKESSVVYHADHSHKGNKFSVEGEIKLTAEEYGENDSVLDLEQVAKNRIKKEFETDNADEEE